MPSAPKKRKAARRKIEEAKAQIKPSSRPLDVIDSLKPREGESGVSRLDPGSSSCCSDLPEVISGVAVENLLCVERDGGTDTDGSSALPDDILHGRSSNVENERICRRSSSDEEKTNGCCINHEASAGSSAASSHELGQNPEVDGVTSALPGDAEVDDDLVRTGDCGSRGDSSGQPWRSKPWKFYCCGLFEVLRGAS